MRQSKLFILEAVIGPTFQQFVFEGEFGEAAKDVIVFFFGVAADDVVRLLLSLINSESLEALSSLGDRFWSIERRVHASNVRWHSCSLIFVQRWQLESCIISFGISLIFGRLFKVVAAILDL